MNRTLMMVYHGLLFLAVCSRLPAQTNAPPKDTAIPKEIIAACKECGENVLKDLLQIKDKYPHLAEIEKVKVREAGQRDVLVRMRYEHDITRVEWTEEDRKSWLPNEEPAAGMKAIHGPAAIRMGLAFYIESIGMEGTRDFSLDEVLAGLKCCIGIRPGKLQSEPVGKEIVDIVEKRVEELRAKFKRKP
ncbi:MAG: hypothetical protein HY360_12460 [Verrucomicrobia bacterium]|nr:hypothetical protein [Verrucomicrobiota bacterium]